MGGVVTATILNNKSEMNPGYEVLSIDVVNDINRIPYAQIVLLDGDATKSAFPISDGNFFAPGQTIEIQLYYEGQPESKGTIFKGLVTQHNLQASSHHSLLTLELKDIAFKLATQRKNRVFYDQNELKDDDVIKQILSDTPDITIGSVQSSQIKYKEMVQFYCTDWDFILTRAEANGCWVMAAGGQITVASPDLKGQPKHTFQYGISAIYEVEVDADIQHQIGTVQAKAWDQASQQLLPSPKQGKEFTLAQGNLTPDTLASSIGADKAVLITSSSLEETEAQAWADAQMVKSRLSLLRGRLRVPGFTDIQLGDVMELKGVGACFEGKTLVTGVRHQVGVQGWTTDIQFGLGADWFAQRHKISDAPAAGLLPPVQGLQVGVVDAFMKDPDKRLRVRVKLPMLAGQTEGAIWARLAMLEAGPGRGTFFWPQEGDEVILGFINDDPRQAIILGSVYSEKNPPPVDVSADQYGAGILTKKQLKLFFSDEDDKETITIETPKGNRIVLTDEKEKGIEITDANHNSLAMTSKGIEINSCKDLVIKATSGNITIQGKKVEVQ